MLFSFFYLYPIHILTQMGIVPDCLYFQNQSDAFISGYSNWKNALAKSQGFPKHEISGSHKYAVLNRQQFTLRTNTQTTVIDVLDKGRIELIRKNRQRLVKVASAILLCSRQLSSLRGHDETSSLVYYN